MCLFVAFLYAAERVQKKVCPVFARTHTPRWILLALFPRLVRRACFAFIASTFRASSWTILPSGRTRKRGGGHWCTVFFVVVWEQKRRRNNNFRFFRQQQNTDLLSQNPWTPATATLFCLREAACGEPLASSGGNPFRQTPRAMLALYDCTWSGAWNSSRNRDEVLCLFFFMPTNYGCVRAPSPRAVAVPPRACLIHPCLLSRPCAPLAPL